MMWSLGTGAVVVSATVGALQNGSVPAAGAAGTGRAGVVVAKPLHVNVLPCASLGPAHDQLATTGPQARPLTNSPPPCGEWSGVGVRTSGLRADTPTPNPLPARGRGLFGLEVDRGADEQE